MVHGKRSDIGCDIKNLTYKFFGSIDLQKSQDKNAKCMTLFYIL